MLINSGLTIVLRYQGYLPANIDRRQATLDRKREEYHNFVKQYYPTRYEDTYHDTFRQVTIYALVVE